ncbi:glutaredoxin domain-containing protein [Mycobacterium shottsii]|uniref:glutaredoxin domain-containing protein n=1 Tax=Mycobacterium shottsii TaxID=133549 RepID=UPI00389955B4
MSEQEVVVYWRPGCPFCWRLRRGLRRRGLPTREINIWTDPMRPRRFAQSQTATRRCRPWWSATWRWSTRRPAKSSTRCAPRHRNSWNNATPAGAGFPDANACRQASRPPETPGRSPHPRVHLRHPRRSRTRHDS